MFFGMKSFERGHPDTSPTLCVLYVTVRTYNNGNDHAIAVKLRPHTPLVVSKWK